MRYCSNVELVVNSLCAGSDCVSFSRREEVGAGIVSIGLSLKGV